MERLRLIDLFCGAGGLTLGFLQHFGPGNIDIVWAIDNNRDAAETYCQNFGHPCQSLDIEQALQDPQVEIPLADIVIGGPPCQGFSLLNKQRQQDNRRQLWRPFLEIVRRSQASIFVMENVTQILDSPEYEEILSASKAMGFQITQAKLCAADYGVPQVRWRAFIVGTNQRSPQHFFPLPQTHAKAENLQQRHTVELPEQLDLFELSFTASSLKPWVTVREAIADLPPPFGTEIRDLPPPFNLHFGRSPMPVSLQRYKAIPQEGMNRFDLQRLAPELTPQCWLKKQSGGTDLFGRLWWDRPSVTIRTEFFKPEKGRYLHPEQHRPITHREAARLQSFPDHFIFYGSKIEIAKQIGNAVPPLLAERIAERLQDFFELNS